MAEAILQSRGLAYCLGKKFIAQIGRSRDFLNIPSLSLSRTVHASIYDKNPEDDVRPTVVPHHVIPPRPEQYWCPHPQTGVFGPATDHIPISNKNRVFQTSDINENSVLEQKIFFRSLENLDKPVQH